MQISATFPNQPVTKQPLKILKKIGNGKFNVYQAYNPIQRTYYALKVFPKDSFGARQCEREALIVGLSHPNIIKQTPASVDSDHFYASLTEFAENGNFLELLLANAFNLEALIRTYFHQLIAGLEYMHSQGVTHLDLKLQNLMLGSDFNLKIIDFDQAQKFAGKKIVSRGTQFFRAPEVIDGSCENFEAADLYSVGVILYALRANEHPFEEIKRHHNGKAVTLIDNSTFVEDNNYFWRVKEFKQDNKMIFNDSFKELVNGLLEPEVDQRYTLEQVKKSKWYNGQVLDRGDLKAAMRARVAIFMDRKESESSF